MKTLTPLEFTVGDHIYRVEVEIDTEEVKRVLAGRMGALYYEGPRGRQELISNHTTVTVKEIA